MRSRLFMIHLLGTILVLPSRIFLLLLKLGLLSNYSNQVVFYMILFANFQFWSDLGELIGIVLLLISIALIVNTEEICNKKLILILLSVGMLIYIFTWSYFPPLYFFLDLWAFFPELSFFSGIALFIISLVFVCKETHKEVRIKVLGT